MDVMQSNYYIKLPSFEFSEFSEFYKLNRKVKSVLFLGAPTSAGGRIRPPLLLSFFAPRDSTTRGGIIMSYSVCDRIFHDL